MNDSTSPNRAAKPASSLPFHQRLARAVKAYWQRPSSAEASRMVLGMYRGILERDPDPVGFAAAKNSIQGGEPYEMAIRAMLRSSEYADRVAGAELENFVRAIFLGILNREPELANRQGILKDTRNGVAYADIVRGLISSEEYALNLTRAYHKKLSARTEQVTTPLEWGYQEFYLPELMYWRQKPLHELDRRLDHAAAKIDEVFIFEISPDGVRLEPKTRQVDAGLVERAQYYLDLFSQTAQRRPFTSRFRFGVTLADGDIELDFPLFTFQKPSTGNNFMLPDIDFIQSGFYGEMSSAHFETDFANKSDSAIFVGSTTGGLVTMERLANNDVPRVRAANFFRSDPFVTFALPSIVQCDTQETEEELRRMGHGNGTRISFETQLTSKFLLSMDGNGPTCSRVAKALKSNSVLMKYESPSVLFYFRGLIPWHHYIPINTDSDVQSVIAAEKTIPNLFASIPLNAQSFYKKYLSRESILDYTRTVLQHYTELLQRNTR